MLSACLGVNLGCTSVGDVYMAVSFVLRTNMNIFSLFQSSLPTGRWIDRLACLTDMVARHNILEACMAAPLKASATYSHKIEVIA